MHRLCRIYRPVSHVNVLLNHLVAIADAGDDQPRYSYGSTLPRQGRRLPPVWSIECSWTDSLEAEAAYYYSRIVLEAIIGSRHPGITPFCRVSKLGKIELEDPLHGRFLSKGSLLATRQFLLKFLVLIIRIEMMLMVSQHPSALRRHGCYALHVDTRRQRSLQRQSCP